MPTVINGTEFKYRTHDVMEFTAELPDGSKAVFTAQQYFKWRQHVGIPVDMTEAKKLIEWLQADNLNRLAAWISVMSLEVEKARKN